MKIQKRPCKLLLSVALSILTSALPLHGSHKPNVVFILIDDISHYGVSAYGAKQLNSTEGLFESVPVATPEIDRLANEGVLAKNAFAYAICEPTRVALMTGMNNQRNFVQAKALHESHITFGDLFKRAGYTTGIAGKWKQSRGSSTIPGDAYVDQFGWDHIHCFDLLYEGPRHIDPNFVINGKINWYKGLNPETKRRYYGPELVNRFALDFIETHQDEAFFLYYPMLLVHDEHTPTPDTQPSEHYDNFEVMTHTGVKPDNSFGAFKGDDRRFYPDMVTYMDKMIGKVTDQLDRLGLREKTLIVVMGDNGSKAAFSYTLEDGSQFIGAKGQCKVNGLQVPLILSYPGIIAAGSTYDGLIN
ncbi:MAG: sulfatase-like hydrolase/transferase, partial [Verrucomicrobiota bacterium]|nr:sulfatase-like hydrolase/transferase [Verrucomicrobiota bacterium]